MLFSTIFTLFFHNVIYSLEHETGLEPAEKPHWKCGELTIPLTRAKSKLTTLNFK